MFFFLNITSKLQLRRYPVDRYSRIVLSAKINGTAPVTWIIKCVKNGMENVKFSEKISLFYGIFFFG